MTSSITLLRKRTRFDVMLVGCTFIGAWGGGMAIAAMLGGMHLTTVQMLMLLAGLFLVTNVIPLRRGILLMARRERLVHLEEWLKTATFDSEKELKASEEWRELEALKREQGAA